jgi:hypothetical protein
MYLVSVCPIALRPYYQLKEKIHNCTLFSVSRILKPESKHLLSVLCQEFDSSDQVRDITYSGGDATQEDEQ